MYDVGSLADPPRRIVRPAGANCVLRLDVGSSASMIMFSVWVSSKAPRLVELPE